MSAQHSSSLAHIILITFCPPKVIMGLMETLNPKRKYFFIRNHNSLNAVIFWTFNHVVLFIFGFCEPLQLILHSLLPNPSQNTR